MEEQKKKVKSIEIRVLINKEKVTIKDLLCQVLKIALMGIAWFNAALALVVVGVKLVFGYTLVHSFLQWAGINFLAFSVKWIYHIIFSERVELVIPEIEKAQIYKELTDTEKND